MRATPRRADTCLAYAGPLVGRRQLFAAVPAIAASAAVRPARAAVAVAELALACDTTLGPALRAVGAAYANATGVRVSVFAMDSGLILPQLERQVQNDILVTQRGIMQTANQAGVVAQNAVRGGWQNAVVIGTRRGAGAADAQPIAYPDPTPGTDIDAPAILQRLGLLTAKAIGVIDTDTVVRLVLDGTVRTGLMHMTDVRANPALQVQGIVPASVQPPIAYAAAVTALARRPDPARFIEFLLGTQAAALLASLGLESAS